MIHGIDIPAAKVTAKTAAMNHFVDIAREDGVPSQLRAMYVRKLNAAISTLSGADPVPRLIAEEAKKRGVPAVALAEKIVEMAAPSDDLELARMDANIAIDACETAAQIMAVMRGLGIPLSLKSLVSGA